LAQDPSLEYPKLTRTELIGTLAGMLLTLLLAALDQTIIGTAMPRIIAQLHGFERYAWVTAAYLVASTLAVPVFGRLSDLYGRKRLFISGAILFVVASALCGAAGQIPLPLDGMNQLIAFRALQGVGGGMITSLIFTIIGDIFPPGERGKYQGFFAALIGFASIVGPAAGGWITDHLSWRWAFYVNLPVGLIAVAVLAREFPDIRPRRTRRTEIDWRGVALLAAWLGPLLIAFTVAGQQGWTSLRVGALLGAAAAMFALFISIERKSAEPLLPLSLFRDRVILISSVQMFLIGASLFGVVIYLPLFVQGVLGISATASGSLLTPMMLASVVTSIASGQILARVGRYRTVALTGAAMMLAGAVLLSLMDEAATLPAVLRNSVVFGFGFGLVQPLYTLAVQDVAPRAQLGAATALAQFSRSIGCTVGVAVFGSVLLLVYHGAWPGGTAEFANPLQFVEPGSMVQLPPPQVRTALSDALRVVFAAVAILTAAVVMFVAFLPCPRSRARSAEQADVEQTVDAPR
jgi:EmrB/QacA subfamily drug resistance transporter